MNRIERLNVKRKSILVLDMSYLKTNREFEAFIAEAREVIACYPPGGVYTLTNVEGVLFDSETKRMVAEWMAYNSPYVRYAAIIGADGIKKLMIASILKITQRDNTKLHMSREAALEWLTSIG